MSYIISPLEQPELLDVLNYAPLGVLVEDCTGTIVWLNHTLEWQLGINSEFMVGAHTSELPLEALPGSVGKRMFRAPYEYGPGSVRYLKCIEDILPEYSDSGIRVRYFLETQDDVPSETHNDSRPISTNPLEPESRTALADRFKIIQTLRYEVSRSRRYGRPLAVVVARILPQPQSGRVFYLPSKIMSSVGRMFKNGVRWADSVGACDEWEFLFVLPETTVGAATAIVRKIELELEDSDDESSCPACFDTLFGVAEWRRGDDETSLLVRAQDAMVIAVTNL